jgi:anti-sigma B factor antagonist
MVITEKYEHLTILNLKGSILQSESDVIRRSLESFLSNANPFIAINLLETNHICSSALGQIVYMKNKFISLGGDIKMVVTDEDLLELLEITMLDQVFQLHETIAACAKSFSESI